MTATTALTVQNTQGVYDIHNVPSDFVDKQIDACLDDIGADVIKTGMLASAETIQVVARSLAKHKVSRTVIDPVMVSTSGAQLLPQEAVRSLREQLMPLTTVLTPNLPEALLILKDAGQDTPDPPGSLDDLINIAKAVHALGPQFVLLKGGHQPFTKDGRISKEHADRHTVIDILYGSGGETTLIETDYLDSKNTHGTGCSLASAVASNLANGMEVGPAVKSACRYVEAGIKLSISLGKGSGPINHFHSMYSLPFAPGRFVEYLLDRTEVKDAWRAHTEHDFVARIADGTLPMENFKFYLIQDYLYLVQFARANALAGYKAKSMDAISASAEIVLHIHREMALHLDYSCTAYTRYMLDVGHAEDYFALQIAFAPCLIGYAVIARRLYNDPSTLREGNPYFKWIENYVAEDYTTAVKVGSELLERLAVKQSPSRIEELVKIFVQATRMEAGFWDMGAGNAA
ncbi:MAG: hypothetical protein M4579_004205 [Chaenotheca gracillima]|nr:MAG: hypothetical protein M4579_004205 [Chaenotheca gracillima]